MVSVSSIDPGLAARMRPSWRPGCPVPLSALRYLRVTHWGFDGASHLGELVVHADAVPAVTAAFRALFTQHFRVRQMRLVDDYAGNDDASMAADNTSAFNCRPVAGSTTWSQHSYGRAVDVNPFENPYVSSAGVEPPQAARYARRLPVLLGMLTAAAVSAFTGQGWGWGGAWRDARDYQHFSSTGR